MAIPFLLAHLIGHGWRDLVVYGVAGVGMTAGVRLFFSGRAARLRRDQESYGDGELAAESINELFVRRHDRV